jgi:hypothetical protein
MKVIGAGFGRTGTLSLKIALEVLGFGKCYHMKSVIKRPRHIRAWLNAGRGKPIDWDFLFKHFNATVDFPASLFYDELKNKYPDAKVILTIRDPDTWYKSTERTIYKVPSIVPPWFKRIIPPMEQFIIMNELLIWHGLFKNKFSDRKFAIRIFNEHIKNVRRHIPKEDLLIFNVKDGWRPLCDFLGVPIPKNIPFPHVNTGDNMIKTLNIVKLIPYLTIILVTITLLYYLYLLNK